MSSATLNRLLSDAVSLPTGPCRRLSWPKVNPWHRVQCEIQRGPAGGSHTQPARSISQNCAVLSTCKQRSGPGHPQGCSRFLVLGQRCTEPGGERAARILPFAPTHMTARFSASDVTDGWGTQVQGSDGARSPNSKDVLTRNDSQQRNSQMNVKKHPRIQVWGNLLVYLDTFHKIKRVIWPTQAILLHRSANLLSPASSFLPELKVYFVFHVLTLCLLKPAKNLFHNVKQILDGCKPENTLRNVYFLDT